MTIPHANLPKRQAFSLTEVLVVIAVIAVLAAILIPVVNSITNRSMATKRMNNMRALGNASLLYSVEHDGSLPFLCQVGESAWGGPYWYQQLFEYLPQKTTQATFYNGTEREGLEVLICPLVPEGQHVGCDYGANSAMFFIPTESPNGQPAKMLSVSNPESIALIVTTENRANGQPAWYLNARYYVNFPDAASKFPTGKWTSDSNIATVFADGHYEEISPEDFRENREEYLYPQYLIDMDW